MKVHGHEISKDVQARCWQALPQEFRAHQVQALLAGQGVPNDSPFDSAAYRGADRLLQVWRKAGRISYGGRRVWSKI